MKKVLDEVIKKITPSKKERKGLSDVLKAILVAADSIIKPLGLEKTIAGSFIRDTWLADKKEIDLFILFPVSYSRERLEGVGLDVGKKIIRKLGGKYNIAYAEHPYVKGSIKSYSMDIVPCYKVSSASSIKSAVDRTPFHNRYITRYLKPDMSKEVRLLKQFCKAMDVYGSDVRTLGFSGYLCELLIIKHRDFGRLVRSAGRWKFGEFLDLEGHCSIKNVNDYFKDHSLIVIDPTDPKRNVAAALSKGNFSRFVEMCRKLMKNPSKKFFELNREFIRPSELRTHLRKRGTELFILKFKRPGVVDDVLWSQMRRTAARLARLLGEKEFEVYGSPVWSDKRYSYLVFEMEKWELPEMRKLAGPPVKSVKHSKEFREKYGKEDVFVEGERWTVHVKRKYRKFEELINDFLRRSEKKLLDDGVRSNIAKSVSKDFRVLKSKSVEKLIEKDKEFAIFLRKYFERGT